MWKLKSTIVAFAVVPFFGFTVTASYADDDDDRVEVETADSVAAPEERPEQGERIEQQTATLDDRKRPGSSSERRESDRERDIFRNAIETVPAE